MLRLFYIFLFYILATACSNNANDIENANQVDNEQHNFDSFDSSETLNDYNDDTYTASVDYYNPNTGNSNTYKLDVEVVNNFVTVIHFNNGGWLDETHIVSGGELDENGSTEIESDRGYIYTVTINL